MSAGAQSALSTVHVGAQALIFNNFPLQGPAVRANFCSGYFPPTPTSSFSVGISFPVSAPLKAMAANSSSSAGGASSGNGAGSISGGGNGDGRDDSSKKKPVKLHVSDIRHPLLSLSMRRDPTKLMTPEEYTFLLERGFMQVLDNEEYEKLNEALSKIDPTQQQLDALKKSLSDSKREQEALKRLHEFWLYRVFSYISHWGSTGLRKETERLDSMKNEQENLAVAIHNLETALAALKESKRSLSRFVSTSKGYLGLTKEGRNMLRHLTDVKSDMPFAIFEKAMTAGTKGKIPPYNDH